MGQATDGRKAAPTLSPPRFSKVLITSPRILATSLGRPPHGSRHARLHRLPRGRELVDIGRDFRQRDEARVEVAEGSLAVNKLTLKEVAADDRAPVRREPRRRALSGTLRVLGLGGGDLEPQLCLLELGAQRVRLRLRRGE